MRIRVDLLPRGDYVDELVVLVDILRSCTVAPLLFDNGAKSLTLTASLREARAAAGKGDVLIGERRGVPPEGFNHVSSPASLRHIDFSGKNVVLVSENLPRALPAVVNAPEVLLGSLLNAGAVAASVVAARPERVAIVCAGFRGQEDLDDCLAAGFLAGEIARRCEDSTFEGGARLATSLLRAFPDPLEALWLSSAGDELRRHELAEDLAVASSVSQSRSVPRLLRREDGRFAGLYQFQVRRGA